MEIHNPELNMLKRTYRSYRYYLIFFLIGTILVMIVGSIDRYLLISIISLFILSFLYSIFLHRKILYKVRYHLTSDIIELFSIRYNHINLDLKAKRSEVRIELLENFGDRYPVWQIYFYYKGRLIISQRATEGWEKDMFFEIQNAIKTPIL